jgi:hypothetical protein
MISNLETGIAAPKSLPEKGSNRRSIRVCEFDIQISTGPVAERSQIQEIHSRGALAARHASNGPDPNDRPSRLLVVGAAEPGRVPCKNQDTAGQAHHKRIHTGDKSDAGM